MLRTPEKAAEQLFKQFCEGYKTRNLAFMLNLFTERSTMWGSGLDEYREGLREIETQLLRDWNQSEDSEIEIINFLPTTNTLWAAANCNAYVTLMGKKHCFTNLRGTLIIEKEKGIWKIAHTHCSFPDYRNPENASFPLSN